METTSITQGQELAITHPDGTREVLYKPLEKVLPFHACTAPNAILFGGRGSGKSVALRWEAHIRAMSTPGFAYVILRRTYPELQKSHLMFLDAEMHKLGGTFHHTDKVALYPNGSKGIFSHCSNEEDVLNLLGAELAWAGFDELSTFNWDMFLKLSASVRVKQDSGLIAMVRAATNPLGPSADEINRYFILKDVTPEEDADYNPDDWYSLKVNADSNPYLDTKQYQKRFSGLAAHVRRAWIDGDFALENALFDFYPKKPVTLDNGDISLIPWHVVDDIEREKTIKAAQIYRSYDHGYNPDPAVCLWIAHLGDRYIILHEQNWNKTVASDIAADILQTTRNLGIETVLTTYCDPAIDLKTGQDIRTIKDIFEDSGVPMECSVNKREMFASSVHQALSEEASPNVPRIQIYSRGCPKLVKTLPQQRYDDKHPLRLANQRNDHWTIALAYFLMSHSSESRQMFAPETRVKPWMKPKNSDRLTLGSTNVRNLR